MAAERTARVTRVADRAPYVRSLWLERPAGFDFVPGQFVSCLLPVGGTRLTRPYTIASSPEDPGDLELCFNRVVGGPGSTYLFGVRPGATIDFTGPWGTFTLTTAPPAETVFVAHETGIAAIRPLVRRASATGTHPLRILYGTRFPLWRDELAARPRVTLEVDAPASLVDEVTRRWVDGDGDRRRHFFVCGIGTIVPQLRDLLRGAGYERRAVQYEKW